MIPKTAYLEGYIWPPIQVQILHDDFNILFISPFTGAYSVALGRGGLRPRVWLQGSNG